MQSDNGGDGRMFRKIVMIWLLSLGVIGHVMVKIMGGKAVNVQLEQCLALSIIEDSRLNADHWQNVLEESCHHYFVALIVDHNSTDAWVRMVGK